MNEPTLMPLFTWRSYVASATGPTSPVTRLLLLTLGLHMNEKGGSCFPSTKTLAEETGLSERAVCTHLALAEKEGWIVRKQLGLSGRKWARMEYLATVPREPAPAVDKSEGTERRSVPQTEKALNVTTRGTERHDIKALNDVQCSTSVNSTKNSTGDPLPEKPEAVAVDKSAKPKPEPQPLDLLPADLDRGLWETFLETRKKLKAVNSPRALAMILKDLERYRAEGYDINRIVERSVRQSWKDVYRPEGVAPIARATTTPAKPAAPRFDPPLPEIDEATREKGRAVLARFKKTPGAIAA